MNEISAELIHLSHSLPWHAWVSLSVTMAVFLLGVPAVGFGIPVLDWRSLLKFWSLVAMMFAMSLLAIACIGLLLMLASL